MQEAELKKLLKLTAIELDPDEMPAFLEYFSNMKQMFDEFYEFPLPEEIALSDEEKVIACFGQQETFANAQGILANVNAERLVGNAIEVKSAFGE
jgi:Asp-tRNA(Asn)/Glu-tRNA(Gln) amidotransferase C subunit